MTLAGKILTDLQKEKRREYDRKRLAKIKQNPKKYKKFSLQRRESFKKFSRSHPEYNKNHKIVLYTDPIRGIYYKKRYLVNKARDRSKTKNMEFNIDISDLDEPIVCPILGIEINWANLSGKVGENSPSIDRIDNSKGYIKGNVRVVSYKANSLKSNGTIEEFEKIIKYMKESLTSSKEGI